MRILGVSRRQLQYWAETDLVAPSARTRGGHHRYTFEDLVALRAGVERWFAMVPAERSQMAEAARATIKQRFDRAKAVESVLAIYRRAGAA